jgi:hypothetical protein
MGRGEQPRGAGGPMLHPAPADGAVRVPFAAARAQRQEELLLRQQQRAEQQVYRAARVAAGAHGVAGADLLPRPPQDAPRAERARARGGSRLVDAGDEVYFVACPRCFKPVHGSAMENHLLTQCRAAPESAVQVGGGDGASGQAQAQPLYTDPVRAEQDREFAEALAADQERERVLARPPDSPRPDEPRATATAAAAAVAVAAAESAGTGEATAKLNPREAAAAAALRRLQLAVLWRGAVMGGLGGAWGWAV